MNLNRVLSFMTGGLYKSTSNWQFWFFHTRRLWRVAFNLKCQIRFNLLNTSYKTSNSRPGRYKSPNHNDQYQWTIRTNEWNKPNKGPKPRIKWRKNPEDELHEDLNQLRILNDELKNIGEPSWVSLATSLQNIINSINISHSEKTNLT